MTIEHDNVGTTVWNRTPGKVVENAGGSAGDRQLGRRPGYSYLDGAMLAVPQKRGEPVRSAHK